LLVRIGKVISYFTIITPLIMLVAKSALRSKHSFKLIDPKDRLEGGITISESTINKIQQLIQKIISGADNEAIEWLGKGNNLVFRIKDEPNLVYKMASTKGRVFIGGKFRTSQEVTELRFDNMIKAKEVCLANNLDHLVIPQAKKFNVKVNDDTSYMLIAEESLDINPEESANEALYQIFSTKLMETERQLAIFIAKTGFSDVSWRNIPLINESSQLYENKRVALIDIEHMEGAKEGFLGSGNGSCGLIGCVSEDQIDNVIAIARKQGVAISEDEAAQAKAHRLNKLEDDKKLSEFYSQKDLRTGKEPITVDLDSLGLDLTKTVEVVSWSPIGDGDEQEKITETISLKQVAEKVIEEINNQIQNSSDQASWKGKRSIVLNINKASFAKYSDKISWLEDIINALVNKGYVFKLISSNGHGYYIQA
jgi:hypothetical protein